MAPSLQETLKAPLIVHLQRISMEAPTLVKFLDNFKFSPVFAAMLALSNIFAINFERNYAFTEIVNTSYF